MSTSECSFKSLTSANSNEILQSHSSLTFKLLKTVADFSQALATLHDKFGHELQMLVETFRKRNGELRRERLHCPNSLFQIWELFLQQVEVNSQQHGDISRNLSHKLGSGLIERVFHRKIQSKKTFAHRDRIETILAKSNELLLKCYRDYCQAYALALTNPAQYMSEYIASHNVYVHQLQATNGMIHAYQTKTLPKLLEELEECHLETSSSISSSLLESSALVAEKSNEQASGYQLIAAACKQANHRQDLAHFVKVAGQSGGQAPGNEPNGTGASGQPAEEEAELAKSAAPIRFHQFQAPSLHQADLFAGQQVELKNAPLVPKFKNEIAPDPSRPAGQQQPQLEKDREQLADKIEKTEERIEALNKLLARSTESRLHNKSNEIQEELCQRRFDLLVAQIHLSAVRAQLQLFEYNSYRPAAAAAAGQAAEQVGEPATEQTAGPPSRKTSAGSSAHHQPLGYRNKWIKALKSLKDSPAGGESAAPATGLARYADELRLGQDAAGHQESLSQPSSASQQQQQENQHFFQEYTFKKIASCDVCKDFLRGHMRQGVKCKLCKISCHNDCQSKAHSTIKCQQPKIKLLRRQKSASELEVGNSDNDGGPLSEQQPNERASTAKPDSIYQLIRQVLEAKKKGQHSGPHQAHQDQHHLSAAQSQLLNLSSGNLALANQNGKSVSTSALGGPSASVDRWAVVMDLLAESRSPKPEGKRHSKQLDKFKLAAKSAAAASKHQRHHLQQQQQPQQRQESPTDYPAPQQLGPSSSNPQYGQLAEPAGYLGLPGLQLGAEVAPAPTMHGLQHTKSLPVGHQQQLVAPPPPPLLLQPADGPSGLGRAGPSAGQQQQQPLAYQLLDVAGQQLQSTSAPHSPQRKRFNLRMKSFSLDSPESPSVGQPGGYAASQQLHGSADLHQHHHQQQHQQHQHFQQHQVHLQELQHQAQLQQQQQHLGHQLHYEPSYPSAVYQPPQPIYGPSYAAQQQAYASQQQQQQLYRPFEAEPNDSYLARCARSGRHSSAGGQQYPQHRHSYHHHHQQQQHHLNPSMHFQAHDERIPMAANQQLIAGGQDSAVINGGAQSNNNSAVAAAANNNNTNNNNNNVGQPGGNNNNNSEESNNNNNNPDADNSDISAAKKQASNDNVSLSTGAREPPDDYYELNHPLDLHHQANTSQRQQQLLHHHQQAPLAGGTLVVLYDYAAQRADEIQLNAGQLVCLLDAAERDWWKVQALGPLAPPTCGYFPASYLAQLYQNERPLQVAQTIQVSNGDTCDKLLRGQIVIHTGKQMDNFVTIRLVASDSPDHYIQCPEKYLMEVVGP